MPTAQPSTRKHVDLGAEQRGSGDRVAGEGLVKVEKDTGVVGTVKGGGGRTAGAGAATAGDLNVDALGVELGAVGVVGRVEGDDLVAENVLARGDGAGNLNVPRVAVGNELVGGPV
jgi:hypothetical protein